MESPRFAIIIPACEEEEVLPGVLKQWQSLLEGERFEIVVGVNGCRDRTAEIARECGVLVAETANRGYGYGCQAAIEALEAQRAPVDAYIFVAADGANDPADLSLLLAEFRLGAQMVLGSRTFRPANWNILNFHYVFANLFFGWFCGILSGRYFSDLGPFRLIERELFHALKLREWTYGWTIEAQIRAVRLGARVVEVPVGERGRLAGKQKISHVNWRRTMLVGWQIIQAGWRARFGGSESRAGLEG